MSEQILDEMIAQFEHGTLPTEEFTHAAHVKLAFRYLQTFPVTEVLQRFPAALIRIAAAKGLPGLYHETTTWAFIFLIRERIVRMGNGKTWEAFAEENRDLLIGGKRFLEKYYRTETIASDLAKRVFVFPDRPESLPE